MKHFPLKCLLLFAALVPFASPAAAALITVETFTVNSAQASPTYSATPLSVGVMYTVEVSGFYRFNMPCCPNRQADAEYISEDSFATSTDAGAGNPGLDLLIVYGSSIGTPFLNSAQGITAQEVDWDPLSSVHNPAHTYNLNILGNGSTIGFVISDSWPDGGAFSQNGGVFDNVGLLTITLQQNIPEPSTLLLLGAALAGVFGWRRRSNALP
jgi:hypothetical protein